jgi:hypothetical protein
MNMVLMLALTSLPGADPAAASGGACACKATSSTTPISVTPVAKTEKQPLFHRFSGLFGKRLFHKEEAPPANPSQFNLNAYNNFRPETVIVPEPTITTVPAHQPMLLPQGPVTVPSTQPPSLFPTGPGALPQTPAPTTAEPPLN